MADKDILTISLIERKLNIEIASSSRNMQYIAKVFGEELSINALSGIILITTEYFAGSGTHMTANQSVQTAALILDSYPAETIEDVMLCFKYAKQGRYGKIYNRIDGQIIFEWFRQYLDEKYEYIEKKRHNEKYDKNERSSETLEVLSSLIEPMLAKAKEDILPQPIVSEKLSEEKEMETLENHIETIPTNQLKTLLNDYETKSKRNFWSHFDRQQNLIREEIKRRERISEGSGKSKGDAAKVQTGAKPHV